MAAGVPLSNLKAVACLLLLTLAFNSLGVSTAKGIKAASTHKPLSAAHAAHLHVGASARRRAAGSGVRAAAPTLAHLARMSTSTPRFTPPYNICTSEWAPMCGGGNSSSCPHGCVPHPMLMAHSTQPIMHVNKQHMPGRATQRNARLLPTRHNCVSV